MRIILAIPHYFNATSNGRHGSQRADPGLRLRAFSDAIFLIHRTFGGVQQVRSLKAPEVALANEAVQPNSVKIVVCAAEQHHLLDELPETAGPVVRRMVAGDPLQLGFECHAVLRDHLDEFDFFCYLEDDLCLEDPWFFVKIASFLERAGPGSVLQPNRFELSATLPPRKTYVDGDLADGWLPAFYDPSQRPQVLLSSFPVPVLCRRPHNPHSGCFFLSVEQMAHWSKQTYFLDRDCSFCSGLESAATLGLMRTFRVYKPAPQCASFLEVRHFGDTLTRRLDARDRVWRGQVAEKAKRPEVLRT
jgi:hypothetical protein